MGPVYHNGKLFMAVNWGYLQAFDAATGALLWNTKETESKAGFLFKSTEQIKKDYPQFPAFEEYDELYDAIVAVLN